MRLILCFSMCYTNNETFIISTITFYISYVNSLYISFLRWIEFWMVFIKQRFILRFCFFHAFFLLLQRRYMSRCLLSLTDFQNKYWYCLIYLKVFILASILKIWIIIEWIIVKLSPNITYAVSWQSLTGEKFQFYQDF